MTGGRAALAGLRQALAATGVAALSVACALPKTPAGPALFDLGPAAASASASAQPAPRVALHLAEITAAPWLDTPGIAYRLQYQDAYRRDVYRDSRWAAPPAALLAQRLRAQLMQAGGAGVPRRLHIELDEFSQVFDSPTRSRVRLSLRARLTPAQPGGATPAQRFDIERPAPSPDAAGAVQGLAAASDEAIAQILAWAAQPAP